MTPFSESTIEIPLDKGQTAIVSASRYHLVKDLTWHAVWNPRSATYYAHSNIRETRLGRTSRFRGVMMHRLLCGILDDPAKVVHHGDGNGLNNTDANMEVMSLFAHNALKRQWNRNPTAPHILAGHVSVWRRTSDEDVQAHKASWPTGVEYGLCWCRCGQKTELATKTDRRQHWIEGEPKRFVFQHIRSTRPKLPRPIPNFRKCPLCGGLKGASGKSKMCLKCRLASTRPPIDPEIYYDEEHRPYRRVPCAGMLYTLVSVEDYDLASSLLLSAHYDKSSDRYYVSVSRDGKHDKLHRILLEAPKGIQVDHRNREPLDNRRWNLRLATDSQQMANQRRRSTNTSGFIGVWFRKERNRWCGLVTYKGKDYFTPHCMTAEEAARERDALALQIHGEFANLNFPTR